jgi:hypothetical protein
MQAGDFFFQPSVTGQFQAHFSSENAQKRDFLE